MKLSSFIQSVLGVAICSVLLLSPAYAQSPAVLYDLRCENLVDPLSIDTDTPRLSWKTNYTDKEITNSPIKFLQQLTLISLQKRVPIFGIPAKQNRPNPYSLTIEES